MEQSTGEMKKKSKSGPLHNPHLQRISPHLGGGGRLGAAGKVNSDSCLEKIPTWQFPNKIVFATSIFVKIKWLDAEVSQKTFIFSTFQAPAFAIGTSLLALGDGGTVGKFTLELPRRRPCWSGLEWWNLSAAKKPPNIVHINCLALWRLQWRLGILWYR